MSNCSDVSSGLWNELCASAGAAAIADAGVYSIIASQGTLAASGNYSFAFNNAGLLTVNPKALTITANDAARTYDGVAFSGGNGVSYSGFVNGQNASVLSGAIAYGGNSQGAVNAGTYTIIPSKSDVLELRDQLRQCDADDQS